MGRCAASVPHSGSAGHAALYGAHVEDYVMGLGAGNGGAGCVAFDLHRLWCVGQEFQSAHSQMLKNLGSK